jgi:hypothetical protein
MIKICYDDKHCKLADVAELVDALDLGSSVFGREGSSPFIRTSLSFGLGLTFPSRPKPLKAKSCSKVTITRLAR